MAKLKAKRSILYLNRIYEAGEELPTYDADLINAWLEAGSAEYDGEEIRATPEPAVKASRSKAPAKKDAQK